MKLQKAKDDQIFDEKKEYARRNLPNADNTSSNPPNKFDWQIRDKKKNFIKIKNLNPNSFFTMIM